MADLIDIRTPQSTIQPSISATPLERVRQTQPHQRTYLKGIGATVGKNARPEAVLAFRDRMEGNIRRAAELRRNTIKKLGRKIASTSGLLFFLVFLVASLMDLLGILKLAVEAVPYLGAFVGFAVNFITTPVTLLLVTLPIVLAQYRIRRMNANTQAVAEYANRLRAEAEQMQHALRPVLLAMRQFGRRYALESVRKSGVGTFTRYRSRIILNNLCILLLESVPYVDAGPWQTLKVWRVYVHQQKEHRRAKAHLIEAQAIAQRISIMEQLYLEYLETEFAWRAQQETERLEQELLLQELAEGGRELESQRQASDVRDIAFAI